MNKIVIVESPTEVTISDDNVQLNVTETTTTLELAQSGPQGIQGPVGPTGGSRYDFLIGGSNNPQINSANVRAGSTVSVEIAATGERVYVDYIVTEGNVTFAFTEAPTANSIKVWVS